MAENAALEVMPRGNFGDVVAKSEGSIAGRTMLVGAELMTAELEKAVDPATGVEKRCA